MNIFKCCVILSLIALYNQQLTLLEQLMRCHFFVLRILAMIGLVESLYWGLIFEWGLVMFVCLIENEADDSCPIKMLRGHSILYPIIGGCFSH